MMQLSESNFFAEMHRGEPRGNGRERDITLTMNVPTSELNEIEKARLRAQKPAVFNKLILDSTMKPVAIFILMIVFFSVISTLFAAYFACFGPPADDWIIVIDLIMEVCFALDIVRNFFMQYTDPREPRKPIRDFYRIAKNYFKGSFLYDLIAISAWPLQYALSDSYDPETASLIYLLRLFRLGKIVILMDLQKFTQTVRNFYRAKLNHNIANNKYKSDKTVDNNKIMTQIFLIKGFQVFRLIVFILILSYFLGTLWFVMTKHSTHSEDEYTFYNQYDMANLSEKENLSIVVYFMFTTLSTVGFGDFNPKSEVERVIMTFILLIGVACFSWIMSQFIDILI